MPVQGRGGTANRRTQDRFFAETVPAASTGFHVSPSVATSVRATAKRHRASSGTAYVMRWMTLNSLVCMRHPSTHGSES